MSVSGEEKTSNGKWEKPVDSVVPSSSPNAPNLLLSLTIHPFSRRDNSSFTTDCK